MHTPTLFRKFGLISRPLTALLTLLTLFLGLSASQTALAQAITSSNVTVNIRGTTGGFTATYDTQTGGDFTNRDFQTFDLASDIFRLQGATVTVNEGSTNTYDQGQLFFRVFPGSLANNTGATAFTSIELINNGVADGVRTFSLSPTAARDLLATVTTGGTPGTSYRFDVSFSVTDNINGGGLQTPIVRSVFTATGTKPVPTNISNSNVIITRNFNPSETYGASSGQATLFNGANFGLFDINNTGNLILNGGNLTTFESFGDVVQNTRLIFQVVKQAQNGSPAQAFQPVTVPLAQVGTGTAGNGGTTRTFATTTANRSLLTGLFNAGVGAYNVTVRFEGDVLRTDNSTVVIRDDNMGAGYTALFTLNGTPIPVATWTGSVNDDWFNGGNWTTGRVPDANTNAVVPDFRSNTLQPYPNIFSGVVFTDSKGVVQDNTNSGPAIVRNIDMQGTSQLERSIARLRFGRLQVFGDFLNTQASFIQDAGSVVEFAGSGSQSITGGRFDAVEISGGGTKAVTGTFFVGTSMTFLPNGGLVTTGTDAPLTNYIEFADRATGLPNGAQLNGEVEGAYIRGLVQTERINVLANERDVNGNPDPRTFGNIGLTLFFTGNDPGKVFVTRNTAASFTPLATNADGTRSERYGIRRVFGVRPDRRDGVVANMTFRYLDSELMNLGPSGTGSISESNLVLFLSNSSGNLFTGLGRTSLDVANNTLIRDGITTFATFTLGDQTAPLPVTLVAFDAKRAGNDALVTWETANERNNKGFFVEVSTDGKSFRSLGFVNSRNVNSSKSLFYSFIDAEAGKSGSRYYRLNQIDLDGKSALSPVKVVNFGGSAASATASLLAFPNPFTDNLSISVAGAGQGAATLRLTDLAGRTIRSQQVMLTGSSSTIPVANINDLKAGLYIMQLTLPSGKVQNFKVQKQ